MHLLDECIPLFAVENSFGLAFDYIRCVNKLVEEELVGEFSDVKTALSAFIQNDHEWSARSLGTNVVNRWLQSIGMGNISNDVHFRLG